jgi:hypothetical protein
MDRTVWAYFAGLIDGEGCFMLTKHKNKDVKTGFGWNPSLRIANSDIRPLELLKKEVGGGITSVIKNGKPFYYYFAYSNILRKILPDIIPYLIIKKEEAQVMHKALLLLQHRQKQHRVSFVDIKLESYAKELTKLKESRNHDWEG